MSDLTASRGPGCAYAYCTQCKCVTVHTGSSHGSHYWIERQAEDDEQLMLPGMICNACQPRPDVVCGTCGALAVESDGRHVWNTRRPTERDLQRLERRCCPNCKAVQPMSASTP